jgi:hypothetical protein
LSAAVDCAEKISFLLAARRRRKWSFGRWLLWLSQFRLVKDRADFQPTRAQTAAQAKTHN